MPRRPRLDRWQNSTRSPAILVGGSILLVILVVGIARELLHRYEVQGQVEKLKKQIEELESKKTTLTDLLSELKSPLFQEQEAREKLGKAKPGETVVIVPITNESAQGTAAPANGEATSHGSNPVRWWRYFFGPSS
ncbi:MAG: septum formation initiator family protein [Candidatus Kerfeldbacteria bacterium]|nr:septum formation initiator family protein [Candidatus Kerfeldbacteria bacterium]